MTPQERALRVVADCEDDIQLVEAIRVAIVEATNEEMQRRRKFENEASQAHVDTILLRNECIRLREVVSTLAGFIEEAHKNADEEIPADIAEAMEALFPPEAQQPQQRPRQGAACSSCGEQSFSPLPLGVGYCSTCGATEDLAHYVGASA
jgi:DNA repair exonuclease SbcCD ATPase subunit